MGGAGTLATLWVNVKARTDSFNRAMSGLERRTRGVRGTVGRLSNTIGTALRRGALLGGAAILGFGAMAVKSAGDFQAAMSASLAIMGDVSDALKNDMARAARDVALVTKFSAKDAADSYFFLASAGLDAKASIKALPVVAKFAQAGLFDMALATDLLTDAQSALGLTIRNDAVKNMKNMTRVSDVLAKANTLANASIQQFSESLTNKAGAALRAVNKDVEEGVSVLSAFADQGVKGNLAGNQLAIVLRDLQTAAIKNEDAFKKHNVAVFDNNGNMRHMGQIVGDLEGALEGMSDKQKKATLAALGFTDKSQAALITLLGTSDAILDYDQKLRDAAGTTDEIAEKQLDNLNAQLGLLKDSFIDVAIEVGNEMLPALTDLVDKVKTDIIPEVRDRLPGAIEQAKGALSAMTTGLDLTREAVVSLGRWIIDNKVALVGAITAIGLAFAWTNPLILAIAGAGGVIFVLGLLKAEVDTLPEPFLRARIWIANYLTRIALDIQSLLDVAGKIPGPLGEPFRNASDGVQGYVNDLQDSVKEANGQLNELETQPIFDTIKGTDAWKRSNGDLRKSIEDVAFSTSSNKKAILAWALASRDAALIVQTWGGDSQFAADVINDSLLPATMSQKDRFNELRLLGIDPVIAAIKTGLIPQNKDTIEVWQQMIKDGIDPFEAAMRLKQIPAFNKGKDAANDMTGALNNVPDRVVTNTEITNDGFVIQRASDVVTAYDEVPMSLSTSLQLLGVGDAINDIGELVTLLGKIGQPGGPTVLDVQTAAFKVGPGYATGGVVPGPMGMPQIAVVHGGEEVLTPEQRKQRNAREKATSMQFFGPFHYHAPEGSAMSDVPEALLR